jgi:amidase/6-aminohexanoate-cyclic-dimer hydrolase
MAPVPERAFLDEVGREPGRLRIFFTDKTPYGETIDPEIAAAMRDVAKLLEGLGHHVEERAPVLAADPALVIAAVVSANTAATVHLAAQKFGRAMTSDDFEKLTLGSAHNARKASAMDYVVALQNAFLISRSLTEFFTGCEIFLSPALCQPPVKIGAIDTMSDTLGEIPPLLRRYMPGTSMANMSGQPSMSVPLAWSGNGLPLGMMFTARFGDEATLLRLAAQLEIARPWKDRTPPICA